VRALTPTVGVLKRGVAFYDPMVRVLNHAVRALSPAVEVLKIAPLTARTAFSARKHGFPAQCPIVGVFCRQSLEEMSYNRSIIKKVGLETELADRV
jgi:hypothetical protein